MSDHFRCSRVIFVFFVSRGGVKFFCGIGIKLWEWGRGGEKSTGTRCPREKFVETETVYFPSLCSLYAVEKYCNVCNDAILLESWQLSHLILPHDLK